MAAMTIEWFEMNSNPRGRGVALTGARAGDATKRARDASKHRGDRISDEG